VLIFHTIGHTDLSVPLQHHNSKFKGISDHFPKRPIFSTLQSCAQNVAFHCCIGLSQIQGGILKREGQLQVVQRCIIVSHIFRTVKYM